MGNVIQFRRPEESSEVVDFFFRKKKSRGKVYTKEKVVKKFVSYLEKHSSLPPKTYWYKYPELVDIKVVRSVFEDEREMFREIGWSEERIDEFLSKKKETFSEVLRRD